MKIKYLTSLLFFILFFVSIIANSQSSNVLVVEINGTIDQSTVEIFEESINIAESENSEAIILLLDTPGGGLQQTFDIADLINESSIPVVGYVYPSGSAAWSAGTFILISSHVAAMADHTVIGSAQPVEITPQGTRYINDSKIINALTKWIETRADMYNRNKTIAKQFITKNLNLNETLAYDYGVIEFVATSVEQLIQDINGSVIKTSTGEVTINTHYAKQVQYSPSVSYTHLRAHET